MKAIYAVLIPLGISLISCASTKPLCPPPEVIVQKVPVVQPWPAPPNIPEPRLDCPRIDARTAPVNTILLAIIHDLDALKTYSAQLKEALKVYVQPPSQETPQKP